MDAPMQDCKNPLKRSFSEMESPSRPPDMALRKASIEKKQIIDFKLRSYQHKVFEVATKRNTIAVLETGSGKTMIAVMLMKEIGEAIKANGLKKLILFLAPTVHLVSQQYEVIKIHTNFDVGQYYGAKGVDGWTLQCWKKEFDKHDVLVMTPQILLDALRKAFLNLDMVSLMIIDECHHAIGHHAYTKIMKEFYHKLNEKPRVFGMTASPVSKKGVSSSMDCEEQISELESILESKIYTIEDRTEMDVYIPSARQMCRFYDKVRFCFSDLKAKIEASWSKFDSSMVTLHGSVQSCYRDMDDKFKTMRKQLSNDHAKIVNCLDDLGLMCAYEAVKVRLEKAPNFNGEFEIFREISVVCKCFLEEALHMICKSLSHGDNVFLDSELDHLKAVELGYLSPKLYELLQIFLSFGGAREVLCLIFVERKMTAKVIERFVKKIPPLAHFAVSYLTGTNTSTSVDALAPKMQKEILESFRSGKVNLLFATDVVEEGIHVPNCSCVIRFDLPKTVRSYVQSRGRARQDDSQFIIMLERGNMRQRNQLFDIVRSEWSMTETSVNRDPDIWNLKARNSEDSKAYVVNLTGASVTADSSVSLIDRYCGKLPGDRYYTPRPAFSFEFFGQSCQCKLELPPNAAFQTIVGPVCRNQQSAKQLACLEACKKLHQMGALDNHLLPTIEDPSKKDPIVNSKGNSAGAGTTKRKELHGTTCIHALSGSWRDNLDGATLHAYKFDFTSSISSEVYSGFVLLIESKLDEDVADLELDLYLIGKVVKTSVSSCGLVYLNAKEMIKAKCFQELLFNSLFGKLYFGSRKSKLPREFLLGKETRSLWSPSYMYLLLPLETCSTSSYRSLTINWEGVDACCSVVEFLKSNSCLDGVHHDSDKSLPCTVGDSVAESSCPNSIHLANALVDVNNAKDMVVLAIHTGRLYSVDEVIANSSAESPFEGNVDNSYADYFQEKYGIVLAHPGQPLFRLKQSHSPHNLLVNFNYQGAPKDGAVVEKQRQYAHIPPELLLSLGISSQVLRSLYLLPSLMYHLESLMLASQLRQEIGCCTPNFHISSSLILEAITTPKCCDNFSLERLELLGDSVLKFAVCCHLFLRYPKKHEGQLSDLCQFAVCNSTLHKLGTNRSLQGYIRDTAFEPRHWVAPGQRPIHSVPCKCGLDTSVVPLDAIFQTEDPKVQIGKSCDMGHRWMTSKTISDCVEAIIGAYYISGGLDAALHVMKWFGVDAELDHSLVLEAITSASLRSFIPKEDDVKNLQSKLGYTFSVKFLLQEAMTHATMQEQGVGYCYQRLEFLGDAVLGLLITFYLYQSHTGINPGQLTALRSASVSNEHFARVAVRLDLYKHLQHCSALLLSQITDYVKSFDGSDETAKNAKGPRSPKALGDFVESIAGAMLIDTKLNLEVVWKVFQPLLSPFATLENLEVAPAHELNLLCDNLGYFVKEKYVNSGEQVHAVLSLQLGDVLLVGQGYDRSQKEAKGKAAFHLLKELKDRGIKYSFSDPKRGKQASHHVVDPPAHSLAEEGLSVPANQKKQKTAGNQLPPESSEVTSLACSPRIGPTVIEPINTEKGGPRNDLFLLCKRLQWSKPTFEAKEHQSRTPMEFGEGNNKRKAFTSFMSKVMLDIPHFGTIECMGDARADKKSSFDCAALVMLYELQKQGHIIINGSL